MPSARFRHGEANSSFFILHSSFLIFHSSFFISIVNCESFISSWEAPGETVEVQTSGSTGCPKRMRVEKQRMRASARMTCDFLGLQPGQTALLCMSVDYIAGKMMVVRALERGLRLISVEPDGHPMAHVDQAVDFAAMVPMQVWNSLQVPLERERLQRIRHLIIGGGAVSHELETELRTFPNAVWSTYGMTETLSHIALRRLSGSQASLWYTPMPGIRLSQEADTHALVIDAPALCPEVLHTHDIVDLAADGRFRILGRTDNTVCSGGVKIQIEEVEALLQSHLGDTLQLTSRPDPKFGEALVMLSTLPVDEERLRRLLAAHPYWMPRDILHIDRLPRTATGKPDRAEAKRICLKQS